MKIVFREKGTHIDWSDFDKTDWNRCIEDLKKIESLPWWNVDWNMVFAVQTKR